MADWTYLVRDHVQGDSIQDRYTIRPPVVRTRVFVDRPRRCGQLALYDVSGDYHPEILRAVAINRVFFDREMGGEVTYSYLAQNALLFVHLNDDQRLVLGAMDVETYADKPPVVTWIYLHPEWRRRRVGTNAMLYIHEKYGEFSVEFPISSGMRAILRKM